MKPRFSIVIPTRNRAELLRWSLQSALAQDFDDFEVVVVDNFSTEATKAVVQDHAQPRLRYCRSARALSMPANWEFAWEQARGEYVLYLCDDDALVPDALTFLDQHALGHGERLVVWPAASYFHPTWFEPALRNVCLFTPYRHAVRSLESRPVLDALYRFQWGADLPKMLNSCVQKKHFDNLRARCGALFFPSCPDYSFASVALRGTDSFTRLDKPLLIWGASPRSIGAATAHSGESAQAMQDFRTEFGEVDLFKGCPCRVPLAPTYIAATLLAMEIQVAGLGLQPEPVLSWPGYFVQMRHHVNALQDPVMREQYSRELEVVRRSRPEFSDEKNPAPSEIVPVSSAPQAKPLSLFQRAVNRIQPWAWIELRWRFRGDVTRSTRRFQVRKGLFYQGGNLIAQGERLGLGNICDIAGNLEWMNREFTRGLLPRLSLAAADQLTSAG